MEYGNTEPVKCIEERQYKQYRKPNPYKDKYFFIEDVNN